MSSGPKRRVAGGSRHVAPIHCRLTVILGRGDLSAWLDNELSLKPELLRPLLAKNVRTPP